MSTRQSLQQPFNGPSTSTSHSARKVMKRTSSIMSLPSPPEELSQGRLNPSYLCLDDEEQSDTDGPSSPKPVENPFLSQSKSQKERVEGPESSPTHSKAQRIKKSVLNKAGPRGLVSKGWDSPGNPFIEQKGEKVKEWSKGDGSKPEKVTYVL